MVGFAKFIIKKSDIGKQEEKAIKNVTKDACSACKTDKELAEYVKLALDDIYGGPWNVIVGDRFGGVITYIPENFMYYAYKKKQYLVYSTKNMKGCTNKGKR